MRRRSLVGLAAVVAAGALFAGACGGDDDDADGSRSDDAPEDAARPDSDTADAMTTTAGGATDDGAAGSSADAGAGVDEIGEMNFCDGFRVAIRLDSTTALDGARQLEPPAEIADDWQVFLDFAASSLSNEPPPADVEAAGAAAEEATTNVLDYVGQECGYSVDAFTGEVTEDDGG